MLVVNLASKDVGSPAMEEELVASERDVPQVKSSIVLVFATNQPLQDTPNARVSCAINLVQLDGKILVFHVADLNLEWHAHQGGLISLIASNPL